MTEAAVFQTGYNRDACDIGFVHIGYGAFHRAHQAVYIDDYMQATGDLRWGIAAVNLRPSESDIFGLAAQAKDGYLLKSIAPDGTQEFRAVRSHRAFVDATRDLQTAVDLFARPSVKAVSITVTESGYAFKEDWSLRLADPTVASDLANGSAHTIYGFLRQALATRMKATGAPLTVLCCDNIRNNGAVLENALTAYLKAAKDAALLAWMQENVTFPCSMVDRITPRSNDALFNEVRNMFPRYAAAPIHAEAFTQWVLEDRFASVMPDLGRVGVQVVSNVEPFEEAKIRILNGGHTGLAYLAALAGYTTFDQAMRDKELRQHFDAWETENVLPGLEDIVPFDTSAYLGQIAERFENPGIADQLERICMDGYSKMAIYIRPTLRACLQRDITPVAGYDCVASWVVYARKAAAGTTHIPYNEPFWKSLLPLLAPGQDAALAADPQLWGDLPDLYDDFVPALVASIQRMEEKWQT